MKTITVTKQWQVYIPELIRDAVGLDQPGKAEIEAKDGKIIIKPKKSTILQMAGRYKGDYKKKPVDIENIRDSIDYSR